MMHLFTSGNGGYHRGPWSTYAASAPSPEFYDEQGSSQALLNEIWPYIRGALEKKILRGKVEPLLSKYVPGLHLRSASLGDDNTPPRVHGARTVRDERGAAVSLLLDLGFHPGDKMNVSLALGPIHASVIDFSFRGRLAVCLLGLVPRPPVVGGIRIFFPNAPDIHFRYSGLPNALPVTPDKLRHLLLDALCKALVLPNSVKIHLDSILGKNYREPDFLDHHRLHSPTPAGLLRVSLASVLDPRELLELAQRESNMPSVYANLRCGDRLRTTQGLRLSPQEHRVGWPSEFFSFIVDFPVDQDLSVEICVQEYSAMMVRHDVQLMHGSISMKKLANSFKHGPTHGGSRPSARLELRPSPGLAVRGDRSINAVLEGQYSTLVASSKGTNEEWLLQIVVDCVTGLPERFDGKPVSLYAEILTKGVHGELHSSASLPAAIAIRGGVSKSRALLPKLEAFQWKEVKDRIRLMLKRGATLTPEEISYLLPGMVPPDIAKKLMEEVYQEGLDQEDLSLRLEVVFEKQMRLEVWEPSQQALRVLLLDGDRVIGTLEWSSLEWLANSRDMEEDMREYEFEPAREYAGSQMIIQLKRIIRRGRA